MYIAKSSVFCHALGYNKNNIEKRETPLQHITTPEDLSSFCKAISGAPWFALDTEFIRDRTYYPRLCMLQVATPDHVAVIDTLSIADLSEIMALFYGPEPKIFHAATQDLEIFAHMNDAVPENIFDTQLAASVLGLGPQIGYGALVQHYTQVSLEKSQSRIDWGRRPLPQEALQYAADDVIYLAQIYPMMLKELAEKERDNWIADDMKALSDIDRYVMRPENAWKKLRSLSRLSGHKYATGKALCEWREGLAQQKDLPRGWILRDDLLVDIAKSQPKSQEALGRLRGVKPEFLQQHAATVMSMLKNADNNVKPSDEPVRLNSEQRLLLEGLGIVLKYCANQHETNPNHVCNRDDLAALMNGERDLDVLKSWKREVAGDALLAFLAGELTITAKDGKLVVS